MRTFALSLLLLCCACGPLVQGEAQIAEICRDLDPIEVHAAPFPIDGTFTFASAVNLPKELTAAGSELSTRRLEITSVTLTVDGLADSSFIRSGALEAVLAGATTHRFEWTNANPRATSVQLTPDEPFDVSAALDTGAIDLNVTVDATAPTQAFRVLPRTCFRAQLAAEWSPEP